MTDETTVACEWNRNAPQWIEQVRQGLDTLRESLNNPAFFDHFLPCLKGMEVIDLGCGEGHNTRLLARRGVRMTGVDIASEMIEAAQSAEEKEPLGIRYRLCSYTSLLDFPDSQFDAAVSTMAMMDGPHFDRAVQEVFRILQPGGSLYFSVLHPCFWTQGSRWVTDAHGDTYGRLITNYWSEESYIEELRFTETLEGPNSASFLIRRFPYRLETYFNCLAQAGFRITRIQEPRPVGAARKQHSALLGPIYDHAPVSLLIAASKGDGST